MLHHHSTNSQLTTMVLFMQTLPKTTESWVQSVCAHVAAVIQMRGVYIPPKAKIFGSVQRTVALVQSRFSTYEAKGSFHVVVGTTDYMLYKCLTSLLVCNDICVNCYS